MVIDDEPFILMMIEDIFENTEINVVTLRESKNAIEMIKKEKPDLLILDWMMPDISGIEIYKQLKTDPEISKIPVFMLTAKGEEDEESIGILKGVERYITKPFSPRMLLEIVLERLREDK